MDNFCVKCGGALDAGASFCRQCGSQVSAGPAPAAPVYNAPPGAPPAKGGSIFKFLLIALFLVFAIGIAGVAGLYYYIKPKVSEKMTEFKERTGVDVGAAIESAGKSRPSGERRDGCLMLTREEAERILGMQLVRADGRINRSSDEHCDYYATAAAARAGAEQAAQRLQDLGKSGSGKSGNMKEVEGLIKGLTAGMNDGSTPILQVTIFRGSAQLAITAMNLGTAMNGVKPEHVDGPWDEATMGPMNSMMTVRKGDNGAMLDLRQLTDGREKGLEMAKVIVSRF
jgi:hypothetical protein